MLRPRHILVTVAARAWLMIPKSFGENTLAGRTPGRPAHVTEENSWVVAMMQDRTWRLHMRTLQLIVVVTDNVS
jgi:transposase